MTGDVVANCLLKSNRSLEAAKLCMEIGLVDDAASRLYYAIFHAAEAAVIAAGADPQSHRSLHSLVYHQLVRTGRLPAPAHQLLVRAYEARLQGDYSRVTSVTMENMAKLVEEVEEGISLYASIARGSSTEDA